MKLNRFFIWFFVAVLCVLCAHQWYEMELAYRSMQVSKDDSRSIGTVMTMYKLKLQGYENLSRVNSLEANEAEWNLDGSVQFEGDVKYYAFNESTPAKHTFLQSSKAIAQVPFAKGKIFGNNLALKEIRLPHVVEGVVSERDIITSDVIIEVQKGVATTQKDIWIKSKDSFNHFKCGVLTFTAGSDLSAKEPLNFVSKCPGEGALPLR